ncbi:MAG: class II fructose-bisphosphate aldolase [Candidatus Micrarchaeia archaeon]
MEALGGAHMFNALNQENCIILAANVRIVPGVLKGMLRAAKDADSAVIFELAKSECNLEGGYTGMTPASFASQVKRVAGEVGFREWVLHADHLTVKKGTADELKGVKELIDAQVDAGFSSFAIDASFLFDSSKDDLKEALAPNAAATVELFEHIESSAPRGFGLEVEVGEIGKKNAEGLVLTSPEEATAYLEMLRGRGVYPHLLAIANGSSHGDTYVDGKRVDQVSIDIPLTKRVAAALRADGFGTRLAQHGITGTPIHLIAEHFPKGDILKGNVGTHWMTLTWDVLRETEPALYKRIWDWTLAKYKADAPARGEKSDEEIFGKHSKQGIGFFKKDLDALPAKSLALVEEKAYATATDYFKAFNSFGTAAKVRGGGARS